MINSECEKIEKKWDGWEKYCEYTYCEHIFCQEYIDEMNLFWMFYHTQQNATLIDIIFKGGSDAGVTTVDADWPGGLPGKDW